MTLPFTDVIINSDYNCKWYCHVEYPNDQHQRRRVARDGSAVARPRSGGGRAGRRRPA
ncbi:hypothetical protein MASSI9I_70243 [Massilia sp. 9I]|nr:hypothetical protein MASSI9I_70243 [Massilia sp. 9I]